MAPDPDEGSSTTSAATHQETPDRKAAKIITSLDSVLNWDGAAFQLQHGYAGILDLRETEEQAQGKGEGGKNETSVAELFFKTTTSSKTGSGDYNSEQDACDRLENDYPFTRCLPMREFLPPSARWAEMPPRHLKLVVVIQSKTDLEQVQSLFFGDKMNTWAIEALVVDVDIKSNIAADHIIHTEDAADKAAKVRRKDDVLVEGPEIAVEDQDSAKVTSSLSRSSKAPSPVPWCLWRPNPLLEQFFENKDKKNNDFQMNSQKFSFKTAVDLGCGSGRDAVYLALRLGFDSVLGLDCVPKAVERSRAFARAHGVEGKTEFRTQKVIFEGKPQASVESGPSPSSSTSSTVVPDVNGDASPCPPGKKSENITPDDKEDNLFDLVLVSRTALGETKQQRQKIVDSWIKKGGVVLWHHFLEGCAHPKTGLLGDTELRETFSCEAGYELLLDKVITDPVDGRRLSAFAARKKSE
ncbi:unnamed protein product [Amoebophrya sp. A25]|nr:unnamed protein product [Amoebophrya sp. A25]|eukprot:GSA25T00023147001.1